MGWSSKMFWTAGVVMLLASFGLIAVAAVATSSTAGVENRLTYLSALVLAAAVLITSGLFHVAGAVLYAAERVAERKAD